jgi:hypothetical protein
MSTSESTYLSLLLKMGKFYYHRFSPTIIKQRQRNHASKYSPINVYRRYLKPRRNGFNPNDVGTGDL